MNDQRFLPFRVENFDAARFTSRALSDAFSSAQTTGNQLREDVKILENDIRKEVIQKQSQLHSVVEGLGEVEVACFSVDRAVQRLSDSVNELKTSLEAPIDQLRLSTRRLRNLRSTTEAIREISRRLKLVQKLRRKVEEAKDDMSSMDLPEAARILSEIETSEMDLKEIQVLEKETVFVSDFRKRLRSHAEVQLIQAHDSLDPVVMGNTFHVFFNLKELPSAVEMLIHRKTVKFHQKARTALDFHRLASGTRTSGQSSLNEIVWSSVQSVVAELEEDTIGVYQLQQVLAKTCDPISQISFLSELIDGKTLISRFWEPSLSTFERSLAHAVQPGKSTPVREILVHGFPKLCSILEVTMERFARRTRMKDKDASMGNRHLQELIESCQHVQTVFTTRLATHMSDAIETVFPTHSRTIPAHTDIQKLISIFHEEIKHAEASLHTSHLVANEIANAALTICQKVRELASTGPELKTIGTVCNTAQVRNMGLCSNLQEIHKSLASAFVKLEGRGVEFMIPACDALKAMAMEMIAPIFKAIVDHLEQLILEMHSLTIWRSNEAVHLQPSKFLQEMRSRLRTFSMEFLSRFTPPFSPSSPSFIRGLVKRMACRLIVFYVKQASLIKTLTPIGRQQLEIDANEMENVVSQTLIPVHTLRYHASTLRAFRELNQTSLKDSGAQG